MSIERERERQRVKQRAKEGERERALNSSFYRIVFDIKKKKFLLHNN